MIEKFVSFSSFLFISCEHAFFHKILHFKYYIIVNNQQFMQFNSLKKRKKDRKHNCASQLLLYIVYSPHSHSVFSSHSFVTFDVRHFTTYRHHRIGEFAAVQFHMRNYSHAHFIQFIIYYLFINE